MPKWTLISHHGLVLTYVARHAQSTIREIASAIKITEWTVHRIIADLEKEKYVERKRVGRRNVYYINPDSSLRHEVVSGVKVADLLQVLKRGRS